MAPDWTHSWRFALIRSLAVPMPGLPKDIPFFRDRTMIELIMLVVTLIVSLDWAFTSTALNAGSVANILGFFCVIMSLRSNALFVHYGLSIEKALFWHKSLAAIWVMVVLVHGIRLDLRSATGVVSALIICTTSTLYFIHRFFQIDFKFFQVPHIVLFFILIPIIFAHGGTYVGVAGLFWLVDIGVRFALHHKTFNASLTRITENIVKVEVPRTFKFKAGQFCFIMVKDISQYEYHPFSIASGPDASEEKIVFYMRNCGDWTQKLVEMGQPSQDQSDQVECKVSVEGPYGSLRVHFEDFYTYKVLLLVAGGIGITPVLSMLSKLVQLQKETSGFSRRIVVVWAVRETDFAQKIFDSHLLPFCQEWAASSTVDAAAGDNPPLTKHHRDVRSLTDNSKTVTSPLFDDQAPADSLQLVDRDPNLLDAKRDAERLGLEFNLHLSSFASKQELLLASNGEDGNLQKNVWKHGRPNFSHIFTNVAQYCRDAGGDRVAVMLSGPQPLIEDVRGRCDKTLLDFSKHAVRFDCHEEAFHF